MYHYVVRRAYRVSNFSGIRSQSAHLAVNSSDFSLIRGLPRYCLALARAIASHRNISRVFCVPFAFVLAKYRGRALQLSRSYTILARSLAASVSPSGEVDVWFRCFTGSRSEFLEARNLANHRLLFLRFPLYILLCSPLLLLPVSSSSLSLFIAQYICVCMCVCVCTCSVTVRSFPSLPHAFFIFHRAFFCLPPSDFVTTHYSHYRIHDRSHRPSPFNKAAIKALPEKSHLIYGA